MNRTPSAMIFYVSKIVFLERTPQSEKDPYTSMWVDTIYLHLLKNVFLHSDLIQKILPRGGCGETEHHMNNNRFENRTNISPCSTPSRLLKPRTPPAPPCLAPRKHTIGVEFGSKDTFPKDGINVGRRTKYQVSFYKKALNTSHIA
jgi:hypothetical protein